MRFLSEGCRWRDRLHPNLRDRISGRGAVASLFISWVAVVILGVSGIRSPLFSQDLLMKPPESLETPVEPGEAPPPVVYYPPMPISWRLAILAGIVAVGIAAYLARNVVGLRGQSM